MDGWNTTFLLGRPIFRGYVSFREGTHQNAKIVPQKINMSTEKGLFQKENRGPTSIFRGYVGFRGEYIKIFN